VEPGVLATIQDGGRPDAASQGVPIGGAADPTSLAIANLIVGNRPNAPAVELTLGGFEATAEADCTIGIAGADLGARVAPSGRVLVAHARDRLRAGETIAFAGPRAGGLRAYLALPSGVDAPLVLGSTATLSIARIGGLHGDGQPLRARDMLRPVDADRDRTAGVLLEGGSWPDLALEATGPIRVLAGPHAGRGARSPLTRLLRRPWTVGPDSDRMGLRLDDASSADDLFSAADGADLVSFPVTWGAIQMPPGGRPIVLLCDHQTIGGYPVPAVVIRADIGRLGQLRPGDEVAFETVSEADARVAERERREALELVGRILSEADPWADLAAEAGG
jgi:biotin-dependent carboxylase-like uncharacterized protein